MDFTPAPDIKLAGVLAPLFSLRGSRDPGIGDVAALGELIDWAAAHRLGFVQLLPINETGGDHSPYNLLCSMAVEPATISCEPAKIPWLEAADCAALQPDPESVAGPVDYPAVKARKRRLLEIAFERFRAIPGRSRARRDFEEFRRDAAEWIGAYALHHALADHFGLGEDWSRWPHALRCGDSARDWLNASPSGERRRIGQLARFHCFVQWVARSQWQQVRGQAAARGIALIGDIPVGVSIHSVDVWSQPELFDLTRSSGAPPEQVFQCDAFTMQWGQNWGFPLYNWQAMSHDNFRWWRRRLQMLGEVFDLLRVDHALGFFRIYSFPWRPERNEDFVGLSPEQAGAKTGGPLPGFVPNDDDTAEHRRANQVHGEVLLGILAEEFGAGNLIAEDLGEVPDYVRPALARMGMPGFKIPQWERLPDGRLIAGGAYPRLSIATYSTHDHPPLRTIWEELRAAASGPGGEAARAELNALLEFCGEPARQEFPDYGPQVLRILLRGLLAANSWLAAVTINDLLGSNIRFNVPGIRDTRNWTARMPEPVVRWDQVCRDAIAAWSDLVPRDG